ncbi:hypothetical protein ACFLU5_16890 [Bacteroidota bacterium]
MEMLYNKYSVHFRCLLGIVFIVCHNAIAQSNNHWSRNFNEESSLLSGAVVGGGAGPAAIFYNPASISEIKESKISLNASLFSFEFLNSSNTWGDEIDLKYSRGVIVPRFISYMLKPKNHPKWSLEIAFLNNEDYKVEDTKSIDQNVDVLTKFEGTERYNTFYNYRNKYRDDWLGIGGSLQLGPNLFIGTSMFASIKSRNYFYSVDIIAVPDSKNLLSDTLSYNSSSYTEHEYTKFNDYRLLFKIGLLYKKDNLSLGLNITTSSIGNIYSDGKEVLRKKSQGNITNPLNGLPIPDFLISDFRQKKEVRINAKSPFSVAGGITYSNRKKSKTLYLTAEYFTGLDSYKLVQANENDSIGAGPYLDNFNNNEWLTFISGAKPVLNLGTGFRWIVKENLMILSGFRTDFNFRKDFNNESLNQTKSIKNFDIDKYHLTGGLNLRVMGQDLIAGLQYTLGYVKNQQQFVNFSNPIEYNFNDFTALQGIRQYTMSTTFNAFTIYFGATINLNKKTNN